MLLDKDRRGVSDFNKPSEAEVELGSLWEVAHLGVFSVELREELHIVLILGALISSAAWVSEKGIGLKHLLEFITMWLAFEAAFNPYSHFFIITYYINISL